MPQHDSLGMADVRETMGHAGPVPADRDNRRNLSRALLDVERFILLNHYEGYDPYDALMSPVFALPVLRSNKTIRWAAQQALKRVPFNYRPLLGIRPGLNPVTLGLCLDAFTVLAGIPGARQAWYREECRRLVDRLEALRTPSFHGASWGYDFHWESRHARFPAFTPTVVATGIIANALFRYHRRTGNSQAGALVIGAAEFVSRDLQRTYEGDTFCFSYSPHDTNRVLNATMKGARILAQAYAIGGPVEYKNLARQTVRYVAGHQRASGAWGYAVGDERSWSDNFHTGYILDCLQEYQFCTDETEFEDVRRQGVMYFVENFVDEDGAPRYFDRARFPIDSTAGAQCIMTLLRNNMDRRAREVAAFMIQHMQDRTGYFYYRMEAHGVRRTPFMRWSNAWMFAALAQSVERHNVLA